MPRNEQLGPMGCSTVLGNKGEVSAETNGVAPVGKRARRRVDRAPRGRDPGGLSQRPRNGRGAAHRPFPARRASAQAKKREHSLGPDASGA